MFKNNKKSESKYSKTVWEKGVKTVFGNSTKIKPKDSVIINNGVDLSIFKIIFFLKINT